MTKKTTEWKPLVDRKKHEDMRKPVGETDKYSIKQRNVIIFGTEICISVNEKFWKNKKIVRIHMSMKHCYIHIYI